MKRLTIILIVVLLVAGCEGERGPVGPAGNANIITGTVSPTNAEWLCCGNYSLQITTSTWMSWFTRYVDISLPEITPEIISTGAILVYFEPDPGTGDWAPLPYQFMGMTYDYMINIVHEVSVGLIRLNYFNMPTSQGVSPPDLASISIPTYTFKYTVIEGAALEAMTADGIDVTDHVRVLEYLAAR